MGAWLLFHFSPETLSWVGFVGLIGALIGEAGNALIAILTGWEKAQKELALVFAILAAGAYAVERVGDDAIISRLESRASTAEKASAWRSLSSEQGTQITEAVKGFPGQKYAGQLVAGVPDAPGLWKAVDKALTDAKWERQLPWGIMAGDPPAGISVSPNSGVTFFVPAADRAELDAAVTALFSVLKDVNLSPHANLDAGPQARHSIIVIEIGTKPQ